MTVMSLDELKKLPPLTDEEKQLINKAKAVPSDDCPEMNEKELKEFSPWYDRKKYPITIDIDVSIIAYFKKLSSETGVSYQDLMILFLSQCANEKKRPVFTTTKP